MKIKFSKKLVVVEEPQVIEPEDEIIEVVEEVEEAPVKKRKSRKHQNPEMPEEEVEETHKQSPEEREAYFVRHCPYRMLTIADIDDDSQYGVSCPVSVALGYKPGGFLGVHGDELKNVLRKPKDYPFARYLLATLTSSKVKTFPPSTCYLVKTLESYGAQAYYLMCTNWRWKALERPKRKVRFVFVKSVPKKKAPKLVFTKSKPKKVKSKPVKKLVLKFKRKKK